MKISVHQLIIWMFPTSKGMISRYVDGLGLDGLVVGWGVVRAIQIDQKSLCCERREMAGEGIWC